MLHIIGIEMLSKYSVVFRLFYIFIMMWVALVLLSLSGLEFANSFPQIEGSISKAMNQKVYYRRLFTLIIGVSVLNYLFFTNSRHLKKVLMIMTAWLWANYIDDNIVMINYLDTPESWTAKLALMLRPIILLMISWITFETHLRSTN